ncbi:MAG: hypothetical protein NC914_01980 [Candidatus Omnitrophica bacterium]|nr:hypothetical protein [Candidatus Omnitrophota bacterium]
MRFKITKIMALILAPCCLGVLVNPAFSQDSSKPIEFVLDAVSPTQPLPAIFSANLSIDIENAAVEEIEKDLGLNGLFRLRWDFWQISQLEKDKVKQRELLERYKAVIKKITAANGRAIVCLINTPVGIGRTLDKRSAPEDTAKWKELVKETIRQLSCENKYNVWYEVWERPAQEEYFLGMQKDYLNLYKATARAVLELEKQYNMHIPLGGPAAKNWYDNFGNNSPLTPERSLIYDLMRFCSQNNLPLDFISWQTSSTQADQENQTVAYNRKLIPLIKEWLTYFGFKPQDVTLVVEVNDGINDAASFIPARLKNMRSAGVDAGVFDLGGFYAKQAYRALRYLKFLGDSWYPDFGSGATFIDGLATKKGDDLVFLFWNYIDPQPLKNQIDNIYPTLTEKDQSALLEIIKSNRLKDILNKVGQPPEINESEKLKCFFENLTLVYDRKREACRKPGRIVLSIKNIKGRFKYSRYVFAEGLGMDDDELLPQKEEKKVIAGDFAESIELEPYSVALVALHKIVD